MDRSSKELCNKRMKSLQSPIAHPTRSRNLQSSHLDSSAPIVAAGKNLQKLQNYKILNCNILCCYAFHFHFSSKHRSIAGHLAHSQPANKRHRVNTQINLLHSPIPFFFISFHIDFVKYFCKWQNIHIISDVMTENNSHLPGRIAPETHPRRILLGTDAYDLTSA